MSTFDSTKTDLKRLLDQIVDGKIQLPDFQRGWVWNDEHIRSLLVSIARSFPIGAVMLLETGGETRFQMRPVEGVILPKQVDPEQLILDGQQRLTSLTQVIKLKTPVLTRDDKNREIRRHYYIDIDKAMSGLDALEDSIVGVGEDRMLRENFGRDTKLDLSTPEKEYAAFHFPCDQIFVSDDWEMGLNESHPGRLGAYMQFRQRILAPFRSYSVPVIELKKETSKEAVCLVFEKVNTGGVPLSVFELVTASYAADGFNLRKDWSGDSTSKGRSAKLHTKPLLKDTSETDFLQGISLLDTYERRQADLKGGNTGRDATGVSAKREHILAMPLAAYQKWADPLTKGFLEAEKLLRHLGFYDPKYLPYRAQLIPLAATLSLIGERWLEPKAQDRLSCWFWCGVFGELYGSATETRIALDVQHLLRWIEGRDADIPATVAAAGFQESRLETMRSRTSAAYRGLYVLLQKLGAEDFYWKARIVELDRDERKIDIHHIFPRKWCEDQKKPPKIYNSIINKTPISYKANRKIGGRAPSTYLTQLQDDPAVRLPAAAMDAILATHSIEPALLRADNFEAFIAERKKALLSIVAGAMGKPPIQSSEGVADDEIDPDDEEEIAA